jgi:lysophospholipase L1-like esterase
VRGGLVALGDSITVGSAVAPPWVRWLAEALGMPWTSLASNGALVAHVLREQLPRVGDGHALACLYAGVNDARGLAFDPIAYERDLLAVAQALRPRSETLLLCTLPLDLGRPPAAPKPAVANEAVRRVASAAGAVVCALDDFGGPAHVLADAVHPTRAGQIEIADRAARALRLKTG